MDIIIARGRVLGVVSFTTGFIPCRVTPKRLSESDVLARALWLERHEQPEEADRLLDQWCKGRAIFST